jgi:hypothetical protein
VSESVYVLGGIFRYSFANALLFSSFYTVNRLRGYHAQKRKLPGHEQGAIQSYYATPDTAYNLKRRIMLSYHAIQPSFWMQEFPVAWRDIDHDIEEEQNLSST